MQQTNLFINITINMSQMPLLSITTKRNNIISWRPLNRKPERKQGKHSVASFKSHPTFTLLIS